MIKMLWQVILSRGEGGVPVPKRGVPVFLLAVRATQPPGYQRIEKSARAKCARPGLGFAGVVVAEKKPRRNKTPAGAG
jgi:hypothetical protein